MLEPEILKPYLLDDDPWVRGAVARYFDEGWFQDEDLAPTILDACDRFGYLTSVPLLPWCRRFPLTPATFERVLQLLKKASHENTAMHFSGILADASIDLLHKHKEAVLGCENLLERHHRTLLHRLDFMSWSEESLWQELQATAQRYDGAQDSSELDFNHDDALIDALAAFNVPDSETICRLLADPETAGTWLEMFLIDLAGARRLTETIPLLIDMLRGADGSLPENCPQTLARIGHREIVRRITGSFLTESLSFRDASASILGEIKHPESEDAILAFLEDEDDIEIRTELCHGLCQLFSERGVEVVRQQIHDGYEEWIVSLEEALLPVAKVLGIELPEAEQWRREREELEQYQLERRRELDEMGAKYDALKKRGIDPFAELNSTQDVGQAASTTYRRHDGKVGRNDPCPCGSGKKHKKCCQKR